MNATILIAALLAPHTPGPEPGAPAPELRGDGLGLEVSLNAESLEVGGEYEFVVRIELEGEINPLRRWNEGYEGPGVRRPILLIDPVDAIELLEEPVGQMVTPEDYQNSFLNAPYGRLLYEKEVRIPFRLVAEPDSKQRPGFNLVGYVGGEGPDDAHFVRLRADLKLTADSRARGKPSKNSRWGPEPTLAIGDEVSPLSLPTGTGETIDLAEQIGKQNLLIVLYRDED